MQSHQQPTEQERQEAMQTSNTCIYAYTHVYVHCVRTFRCSDVHGRRPKENVEALQTQPQSLALAFQALVRRASLAAGPLLVRRRFGIWLVIRHSRTIEHEVAVPYGKG